MAIRSTSVNDFLRRTTNLVQGNHAFTCSFWMRYTGTVTPTKYRTPFLQVDDPAIYSKYVGLYTDGPVSGDDTLDLEANDGTTFHNTAAQQLTNSVWVPVAYVRSGSSQQIYFGGKFVTSFTLNLSGATFGFQQLLSDTDDTDTTEAIEICSYKEWNIAQFEDNLLDEWNSLNAVVHTSGLVAFTPLTTDALDISGNGNNWTIEGSPTFVATEPVFPTNLTPATAINLGSLPVDQTFTVNSGNFINTTWYKYTTTAADYVLWIFGVADLINFLTDTRPWTNPSDTFLTNGAFSSPFIIPVSQYAVGTTIYISVAPGNGSNHLIPEPLTIKIERWVQKSAPINSVIIPNDEVMNDNNPFPLAFVDPSVSNGITTYVNGMPVTESMAILADGTIAMGGEDAFTNPPIGTIFLFDKTLTAITSVRTPSGFGPECITKKGDDSGFWILDISDTHAYPMDKTGVIGTAQTLQSKQQLAASPDNSILYYQGGTVVASNTGRIHRWATGSNSAMSDLTPLADNSHAISRDILCLADGTLIVMDQVANRIYHISAAGAVLHTITPPIVLDATFIKDRMCIDPDGTTFWCYLRGNNPGSNTPQPEGQLNLVHLQVDGTVLSNEGSVVYPGADGGYDQEPVTLTPIKFGASSSCPIGILPFTFSPPNLGGTIIIGKASPQTNSQIFTMTLGGDASMTFTIGFEGTEILSLAPGTYSIVETPDPNYQPQYLISNDPVNNNNLAIVVNSGDNLAVVIVNNLSTKYGGLYQLVPDKTNDTVKNQDGTNIDLMINWFWQLFIARDK